MKKVFAGLFFTFVLLLSSQTTHAADHPIQIDGVAIASDVLPEIKNNRTMVPLRVISENLGANVEWTKSEVILARSDVKVKLTLNSSAADKNGKKLQLDVKPYVKNNRVFVPLRFIAETFGCSVKYGNTTVTVETKPLFIDGVQVKALQEEYHMTMGGVVQQINGNAFNEAIYKLFAEHKGTKVEAPAEYSWWPNIDTPGFYYKNAQYDFLDSKGNSFVQFDVYSLLYTYPSEDYPQVLLHDVSKDEWYLFSDPARQSIQRVIDTATKNGMVKIISNTVV